MSHRIDTPNTPAHSSQTRRPHSASRSSTRAVTRRKTIRRIPLKSLEALSPDEVAVGNRLLRLLPAPVPGERLLDKLADELERLVGIEHDIFFHSARTYPGSDFCVHLADQLTTTFVLAPDPDVGVLTADMNLISGWLEELLEDEPPDVRTLSPLSARDFGLVTFIFMHLVNWLCHRGLPPLSLASSPPDLETTAQKLRRHTEIVELVYCVSTPSSAGLVRLFVPSAVVRGMEVFVDKSVRRHRQRRRLAMSRLGSVHAHLPVVVAHVPLARGELRAMGEGDLLLPIEDGVDVDGAGIGAGELWLDRQGINYLRCQVRAGKTQNWRIEITAAAIMTRSPQGDKMSAKESRDPSQPQETHADELASDLFDKTQVSVEIRLGEMPMPVSMFAQIQSGYVLELERRVDDGVDLVVDGRLIGTGELVSVEGRLGVRVLSLHD